MGIQALMTSPQLVKVRPASARVRERRAPGRCASALRHPREIIRLRSRGAVRNNERGILRNSILGTSVPERIRILSNIKSCFFAITDRGKYQVATTKIAQPAKRQNPQLLLRSLLSFKFEKH